MFFGRKLHWLQTSSVDSNFFTSDSPNLSIFPFVSNASSICLTVRKKLVLKEFQCVLVLSRSDIKSVDITCRWSRCRLGAKWNPILKSFKFPPTTSIALNPKNSISFISCLWLLRSSKIELSGGLCGSTRKWCLAFGNISLITTKFSVLINTRFGSVIEVRSPFCQLILVLISSIFRPAFSLRKKILTTRA